MDTIATETDIPVKVAHWERHPDGGWRKVQQLDVAKTLTGFEFNPTHNDAGAWWADLPWGAALKKPVGKKDRVTFDFRAAPRFTGIVEDFEIASDSDGMPVLRVLGLDALTLLGDPLGWPNPGRAINDQQSVRWYGEGAAETVLLNFIRANAVDRLGYDLVVPNSLGRGVDITINSEFSNVLELAQEKANLAGLGIRITLVDDPGTKIRARETVQVYIPSDRSRVKHISSKSGNLTKWSSRETVPEATRAIIQRAREQNGREVDTVNITNNRITVEPKSSGLRTGDVITFSVDTAGALPAPLEPGVGYHAVKVDPDTFQVALTHADASRGTILDLTTTGSGKITVTEQTRRYRQVTSTGPEDEWGRKREVLVFGSSEDKAAALDELGNQALLDGAAQSAYTVQTTEAPGVRYGDPIDPGDIITLALPTGLQKIEKVGAARIAATTSEGLVVELVIGNPDAASPEAQSAADYRRIKRRTSRARDRD